MSRPVIAATAILFALAWPATAEAKFQPPTLQGHVVDTTGTVKTGWLTDRRLEELRLRTGYAIVVFVTGSLQGESIEDVSYATFNAWKIGDAGKDNGILIVFAPVERKIRIETGKGVGGAITDLQANDIIKKLGPAMAQSKIDDAIDIACTELETLIVKEVGATNSRRTSSDSSQTTLIVLASIAGAFLVIWIPGLFSRRFRDRVWPISRAIWDVLWLILRIIPAFGGKRDRSSSKYTGGGGRSGGGGSSGSY